MKPDLREATCVENWPECHSGGYDPRCCRFPKSCSVETRTDLHARIAAAVAETQKRWTVERPRVTPYQQFMLAACDHADNVLARHALAGDFTRYCVTCGGSFPGPECPDVRALADLWLGKGWDQ